MIYKMFKKILGIFSAKVPDMDGKLIDKIKNIKLLEKKELDKLAIKLKRELASLEKEERLASEKEKEEKSFLERIENKYKKSWIKSKMTMIKPHMIRKGGLNGIQAKESNQKG